MELGIIILLIAFMFYWFDSIRAKEIATKQAKLACEKVSIEFLDETVLIKKIRLRRNTQGQLAIYREYEFEFSSTGEYRYKGQACLLGQHLISLEMEPHQFHTVEE